MATPLISVIVPTRNRRALLERTLAAVLGQRLGLPGDEGALEVIVVDEASDDATPAFLADISSRDPRVRVVRHDVAQGVARARNAGLARARGRWVAFCDDDDLWAPGKVAAQLRALDLAPKARWSAVGSVTIDPALRILIVEIVPRVAATSGGGDVCRPLLYHNAIPGGGSGVVADTELVRSLGGFDPALSVLADWDMWIRLALASPLAAVDAPLMAYQWHDGGMSRAFATIDEELAYISEKYERERIDAAMAMGWESMYRWVAMMHLLSRRHRAAASAYLMAYRACAASWRGSDAGSVSLISLGRTALSLAAAAWPALHALRRAQRLRRAPHGWLLGARSWLDELAALQDPGWRPGSGSGVQAMASSTR